jgi:hypothetical protein
MNKATVILTAIVLSLATKGEARETAIGAVFGYPGNVGLSLRFDRTPIGAAWGEDFIHATIDRWMIKKPLSTYERWSWYFGPGLDLGIPLEDSEDFFLAIRAPIGVQFMLSPKLETFGEAAAGIQLLDETDFYWATSVGIRFLLGK